MSQINSGKYFGRKNNIRNKPVQQKTNVYIKNFANEMDEKQLCELFSEYGTITNCRVSLRSNHFYF